MWIEGYAVSAAMGIRGHTTMTVHDCTFNACTRLLLGATPTPTTVRSIERSTYYGLGMASVLLPRYRCGDTRRLVDATMLGSSAIRAGTPLGHLCPVRSRSRLESARREDVRFLVAGSEAKGCQRRR